MVRGADANLGGSASDHADVGSDDLALDPVPGAAGETADHSGWSGNHIHYAERLSTGEQVNGGGELLLPGEVTWSRVSRKSCRGLRDVRGRSGRRGPPLPPVPPGPRPPPEPGPAVTTWPGSRSWRSGPPRWASSVSSSTTAGPALAGGRDHEARRAAINPAGVQGRRSARRATGSNRADRINRPETTTVMVWAASRPTSTTICAAPA